jgi:nucleotide-binding universal stress UspA family protein
MADIRARIPVVVVGVDGSSKSEAVLHWAAGQAVAVRGRLRVVLAWQLPQLLDHVPMRVEASLDEAAEKRVDSLINDTLTSLDIRSSELDVETIVQEGGPVRLLLRSARDADLLVLGSHGHGSHSDALLGSVTQSCLMQAPCPVVVVPVNGVSKG